MIEIKYKLKQVNFELELSLKTMILLGILCLMVIYSVIYIPIFFAYLYHETFGFSTISIILFVIAILNLIIFYIYIGYLLIGFPYLRKLNYNLFYGNHTLQIENNHCNYIAS